MEFPLIVKTIHKKCFSNGKQRIHRFMKKSGYLNFQLSQVPNYKYFRYTKDFANTLVNLRWRWVTFMVIVANFFFYFMFAGLWMLDAWLSGDLDNNKILSIETITTTGYGYLYPTEHCQFAWFTLTLSTIIMILLDGAFMSIVFLKICKPLRKDALSLFSKKCVVSLRNGKLCLVFRIDDHLNKHAINPKLKIFVVNRQNLQEKLFNINLLEVEVTSSGVFLWPTDIVHEINEKSPFWSLSASDFMNGRFEILVTLSGISLVTNQLSTSQTSYLNKEILWGYRFKSFMEYDDQLQEYTINESEIFKLLPCDTPLCSAKTLRKIEYELEEANGVTEV